MTNVCLLIIIIIRRRIKRKNTNKNSVGKLRACSILYLLTNNNKNKHKSALFPEKQDPFSSGEKKSGKRETTPLKLSGYFPSGGNKRRQRRRFPYTHTNTNARARAHTVIRTKVFRGLSDPGVCPAPILTWIPVYIRMCVRIQSGDFIDVRNVWRQNDGMKTRSSSLVGNHVEDACLK